MPVTDTRESGVEILDVEPDDLEEGVDGVVFRTDEDVEITAGESVQGRPLTVDADHFVAASVDTEIEQEISQVQAQMQGLTPEDDEIEEQEDGTLILHQDVDESSVFIGNEEGEVGYGLLTVEEGDIEDAIEEFETDYLSGDE